MTNSLLGSMQWGLTLIFLFSCPWRPMAFLHMANEQNCGAQNCCADQGEVPWKVCVLHYRDIKKCSAGSLGLIVDVALCPGLKATSLAWDEKSDGLEFKGDLCCWVMGDSWFPPPLFLCPLPTHEIVANMGVPSNFWKLCFPDNCSQCLLGN